MRARNETSNRGLEPWNPDEFESALLGSIERDGPPAGSAGKQLTILAAVSASALTVTAAAGAAGAKSSMVLKNAWLLSTLGCVLVSGGIATARWLGAENVATEVTTTPTAEGPRSSFAPREAVPAPPPDPLPAAVTATPQAPTVSVHALPPAATSGGSVGSPSTPLPGSATPAPSPGSAPSATEKEIALLQEVRSDIGAGKPDVAIQALRRLERDGSIRIFAPEARVLMIEALEAHGDRLEAVERADAFLRELPRDPHVARVTRLRDRMTNL